FEIRLHSREAPDIRPEWRRTQRIPRIMDVAKRQTHLVVDVVVDPKQLFTPVCGQDWSGIKEPRSRPPRVGCRNKAQETLNTGIVGIETGYHIQVRRMTTSI